MQLSSNKQQNSIGGKMLLQLYHSVVSIINLSVIKSSQITFLYYILYVSLAM
jgi:hypothetical protein